MFTLYIMAGFITLIVLGLLIVNKLAKAKFIEKKVTEFKELSEAEKFVALMLMVLFAIVLVPFLASFILYLWPVAIAIYYYVIKQLPENP